MVAINFTRTVNGECQDRGHTSGEAVLRHPPAALPNAKSCPSAVGPVRLVTDLTPASAGGC